MLAGPLPALVDYRKMANQAGELVGSLAVSEFPRFAEMLAEKVGEVHLELLFERDEEHRVTVSGQVSVAAILTCQNCLKPYTEQIEGALDYLIVSSEAKLVEHEVDKDSIIYEDGKIPTTMLVEDDLILMVPMIPKHLGDCPESEYAAPDTDSLVIEEESSTTHRPFAGLAEAMKNQDELES